jgi:hypothetical protein
MQKIKSILEILHWPFEHLTEIILTSIIIGCVTILQLSMFNIPKNCSDKIWLSNIILSLIIYFYSKKSNIKEYKEILEHLQYGYPTKEEFIEYENELEEIDNKYYGEEGFNKQREFIIRKRMENTLKFNNLDYPAKKSKSI